MFTAEQLKEISERCEKATRGPWEVLVGDRTSTIRSENDGEIIVDSLVGGVQFDDDADFIAYARTDVPALISHITEMRRKIDDVLVYYRREHASTPLSERRNEAEWIKKLEEVL